jgi:hypothetical protein
MRKTSIRNHAQAAVIKTLHPKRKGSNVEESYTAKPFGIQSPEEIPSFCMASGPRSTVWQ